MNTTPSHRIRWGTRAGGVAFSGEGAGRLSRAFEEAGAIAGSALSGTRCAPTGGGCYARGGRSALRSPGCARIAGAPLRSLAALPLQARRGVASSLPELARSCSALPGRASAMLPAGRPGRASRKVCGGGWTAFACHLRSGRGPGGGLGRRWVGWGRVGSSVGDRQGPRAGEFWVRLRASRQRSTLRRWRGKSQTMGRKALVRADRVGLGAVWERGRCGAVP